MQAPSFFNTTTSHNLFWNLLGQLAPLVAALFTIPYLISGLGLERFGVLTIIWMIFGYFNMFDLGISRAQSKYLSELLSTHKHKEIPHWIWTGHLIILLVGFGMTLLVTIFTPWLATSALNIKISLQPEVERAFFILAVSLPFVIGTTSLSSALEAHHHFKLINSIRIPLGVYTFTAPLFVLPFSPTLDAVVAILVFGKMGGYFIHMFLCGRLIHGFWRNISFQKKIAVLLLRFGGWLTVSTLIGPILFFGDRFFIASILGSTAVAYYTTPFEIITKLLILPNAALGVLFPRFCYQNITDPLKAKKLFDSAITWLAIAMGGAAIIIITGAKPFLSLWLHADFAEKSYRVAQILAFGVAINSLGLIAQARVQSLGHPDWTAKLHLLELPLFFLYLPIMISAAGINGAATAWCLRVTLSTILLFAMTSILTPRKVETKHEQF